MKSNYELDGMNWQENADGSWVAQTRNYKCVALPKLPEELGGKDSLFGDYTYDAVLYQWFAEEEVWVVIDRQIFGAKGAQDAMLKASELLGRQLRRIADAKDPQKAAEKRAYDDLMFMAMHQNNPFKR